MTDTLRDRIAEVQSEHQARANACLCGWKYDPIADDSHFDHVADEVIAALKKDGLIFSIERHDYGQPRPSVFSAIRDFESEQLRRAEPPA